MQLKRLFSTAGVKGTRNYLNSQKKYEVIRTIIYFSISISLLIAGYVQTGERTNLLTIVAILGCLPASKSAVSAIMFLRYKGLSKSAEETINQHSQGLHCLYDMVFTSEKKNYAVGHLVVCGNTICGFTEDSKFEESNFNKHLSDILKLDGHKEITIKIFKDLPKYTARLEQLKELDADNNTVPAILSTLKSVAL